MGRTTTIRVSFPTKRLLDDLMHEGQSYDGFLRELVLTVRQHERRIRVLEGRRG